MGTFEETNIKFTIISAGRNSDILEHNIGYQVDHGDVNKLTRVIHEVKSLSADKKNEIKIKSINLARSCYSRRVLTKKFIDECIKNNNVSFC